MQQESFVELLEQLAGNSADLVRNEIALTKQEIRDELRGFRGGLLTVAVGAVLGIIALMTLTSAVVIGLSSYLPPGIAAILTAIGLAVIGFVITLIGFRQMRKPPLQ